eukprot:9506666-Alexandrium_andersonii.AAC.1
MNTQRDPDSMQRKSTSANWDSKLRRVVVPTVERPEGWMVVGAQEMPPCSLAGKAARASRRK